jgi:hypothetical protein
MCASEPSLLAALKRSHYDGWVSFPGSAWERKDRRLRLRYPAETVCVVQPSIDHTQY